MVSSRLLLIYFKQQKNRFFIAVINFVYFLLLDFGIHAKDMQKITTPHFSILFHKSATDSAERVANTLEILYKPVSKTLGAYLSPIRIMIDNRSTELNGYFKYIPRYINLCTLPHSDPNFIGNGDWLNMLCLHELRHAVQSNIEYHSTPFWLRPLYFGWNVIAVCGVSNFFKEGDAVGIETALSKSGRGRLPGWEKIYKVTLLERGVASFSKHLFGSLKYEMPSEYHMGYYFTTHIRRKYGTNAIKSIFENTTRGIPYFGFCNAIKKVTQKSILDVYKDMNHELLISWQKQLKGLKITPAIQLTIKNPNNSCDYINPFIDSLGNLIAWKIGIGLRSQLVQVSTAPSVPTTSKKMFSSFRKDKTIFYCRSMLPPAAFAIGEGCAVWLEPCKHSWKVDQQTIRLQYYDLKKRKRRTLISSSRYTALAISPSTQRLVAVTTDETGKHFLVILETKSGKVIKKIDNSDNGYYLTPSWIDEEHLVVVKTKDQKNSILRINVATSRSEMLLPYTYEHRSYPRIYKDYLLYNSSYSGIDNIYAMHLSTKSCFQVTSRKYGAYLGMVDPVRNQLIFNDYTINGMDIAVMPFDPLTWTPLRVVEDRSIRYYELLVAQENNVDILEKVPNCVYPFTRYCSGKDNFAFTGIEAKEPNWHDSGLMIKFFTLTNLQDSFKVVPYCYHNLNIFNRGEQDRSKYKRYTTSELGLKVSCMTWYPILEVDIKGTRYKKKWFKAMPYIQWPCYTYNHSEMSWISYWIPELNFSLKFPYYFTLGSSSGEVSLEAAICLARDIGKKVRHSKHIAFNIQNVSTKTARDIHAPWIQKFGILCKSTTKDSDLLNGYRNVIYIDARFNIPGIGQHHYFDLRPTMKRVKMDEYEACWAYCTDIMYGFPLGYPECEVPLIWFLERIWIEGYYNINNRSKLSNINNKNNKSFKPRKGKISANVSVHTIGTTIWFSNRFLVNTNVPYAKIGVGFVFFEKRHGDYWIFRFPRPTFSLDLSINKGSCY